MIKKNIKVILAFLLGMIITIPSVYAVNKYLASDVTYKDTTVENALNELYKNSNECKRGVYYHDGKSNKYIIDTQIDFNKIYFSTYLKKSNIYISWFYNKNISNIFYQINDYGKTGKYEIINKNLYMKKNNTELIYETSETGWEEFTNEQNIEWMACK